ncbi:MAG TPA: hypothetical protein VFW87_16920 [Pirellulales bacterium]|nr:hypothetical protein [Pirellulales bacterium]
MRGPPAQRLLRKRLPRICSLWPGLPQLWIAGEWSGLALAVGFACLVNLLLLTSLHWSEWLDTGLKIAGWTAVGVLWCASAVSGWRWMARQEQTEARGGEQDLFPRALGEYLKGNWYEAEVACHELLRRTAGDVEARLLLATLLRRTRRFPEARGQLELLTRLEAAAAWQAEITEEHERLVEAEEQAALEASQSLESIETNHQTTQVPPAIASAA